jgi:hypothetical protein
MALEIKITVSTPTQEVNITTDTSSHAIAPVAATQDFFEPRPDNYYSFTHVTPEIYSVTNTTGVSNIGSFDLAGAVNVTLGALPYSQMAKELEGFKYVFPDFTGTLNPSQYDPGDLVCLQKDDSGDANGYGSKIALAKTHMMTTGAHCSLFLFLKFDGDNLYLLHKGYFDFEQNASNFSTWEVGRTIYLGSQNKLGIEPAYQSGDWVKSLGFCIPNKDNKKRIWFESDSTYLKIR